MPDSFGNKKPLRETGLLSSSETRLHLFDKATCVTPGDSRWSGRASEDYWAFVGPFGGVTAATILRALMQHPERAGDPIALTVNYCAPISAGAFDLDVRVLRTNRSTQHWSVELSQDGHGVAAFATSVFAVRRASWEHRPSRMPEATPFEETRRYRMRGTSMTWLDRYDFRFVEGGLDLSPRRPDDPGSAYSKLWIADNEPRRIDLPALVSMSDAFFGRAFHVRNELMPFGTVSLTTYFHVSADELAALDITRVLAVADASVFHRSYCDQKGELWAPSGQLLATTQQIAYFKVPA